MQRLTEADCRVYIAIAHEQGKMHLYPIDPSEMATQFCLARRWTSTGLEVWVVRRLAEVQISPMTYVAAALSSTALPPTPNKTGPSPILAMRSPAPLAPSTAAASISPEGVPRASASGPVTRSRLRQEK